MEFRSAYNRGKHEGFHCDEPSLTQQHFADETDINRIMDRYKRTGILGNPASLNPGRRALYGDFSSHTDFLEAQNKLITARESFNTLPSQLRKRFENNPARLLEFLDDPKNRLEAEQLGLIPKPVEGPPETDQGLEPPPKAKKEGKEGKSAPTST